MNNDLDFIDIDLDSDTPVTAQDTPKKNTPAAGNAPLASSPSLRSALEDTAAGMAEDQEEQTDSAGEEDDTKRRDKKRSILRELISYALIIAAAFVLALITNRFLIVNARVPTGSMIPTIMEGDRIIGNRLAYIHSDPERGDIVVFYYPDNENEKYVKRIIGLPGETVNIVNGAVYIDGELLDESAYLTVVPYGSYGPYVVPEGHYFMMGDNRNSSWDSRFWDNTYVSRDKIIAKAEFCYYPSIHWVR